MTIGKVIIEPFRPEEIEKAAGLLARAFTTEPNNLAIFKGEHNLEARQKPLFIRMLTSFPGTIVVAKKDKVIIGVSCISKWPQCHMASLQILDYLLSTIGVLRLGVFREMKIRILWSKLDPKEPHWHIGPIGIEPAFQHRGIGSQLMKYVCDLADKERQPAYLETDNASNVRFYQRFGFSIIKTATVNGVLNSFMWRSAR